MDTDALKQYFKKDLFAAHCACELLDVAPGRAKAVMTVSDRHRNSLGMVHGGAIFTLADFVFAAASNAYGTAALAINVNISFVTAPKTAKLYAEARQLSLHPKLASYTVDVTDEAGQLIAVFQGLVYRKKDPLPMDR